MSKETPPNRQPIAVVGVGALFPGSSDATGFWRDILAGTDLIRDVPESHWLLDDYYDPDPAAPDKTYARRGAFLDQVDFDALGWGVPPSTIPATDTAQLLALVVAQQVLEDAAREQFETMDRSRMSVILGVTGATELVSTMAGRLQRPNWVKGLREAGLPEDQVQLACDRIAASYVPWQEATFPGLLGNVVAGRIANRLDLGGTNCVTDAACASSLSALSMAISELQLGNSDLVISGGVDTLNDIFMFMCFSKTPALSRSGDCRPFSDQADGTMLGEGVGMVALKRLADAERDGDRIYAVIRGVGSSSDGRSKSVYAPVSAGQARALRRTYDVAGYGPETVEFVEAHGTGTRAGDVAEFEGLRQVFDESGRADRQWCALGSVKSQIGHTKAAAGAAGLFKAVMAVHHKVLPPTIKVSAPNPGLNLPDTPFYLSTELRPWIRDSKHPRRASVSSFGFGGSNFHVTLEEYTGPGRRAERLPTSPRGLVLLSGATAAEVAEQARVLARSTESLDAISRESLATFDVTAPARLAVPASDPTDLVAKLVAAATRVESSGEAFALPDGTAFGTGPGEGKVAFLFPGQGSHYVGMGADLAMEFDAARGLWDRAADLEMEPGAALHDVVFPRPKFGSESELDAERLTQTQWAQPSIGCTSLAQLAVLQRLGIGADMVGGHSFGEVTALFAAGALTSETDLLKVARCRGELMADAASEPGAMTAVSLPVEKVKELIARHAQRVAVANHNSPTEVVVSGPTDAIVELEAKLAADGITARRLSVATAFHSDVVSGSCAPFSEFLDGIDFVPARIPVYGNADAAVHENSPTTLRRALVEQIVSPVRFVEMVQAMHDAGARTFVEVGPGSVLTRMVERILDGQPHLAVSVDRKGKDDVDSLLLAVARLAAAGVPMQPGGLFADNREIADAAEPPKLAVSIKGTNYGKLYPPPGGTAALPKPNAALPVSIAALPRSTATPHEHVNGHVNGHMNGAAKQLDWTVEVPEMQPSQSQPAAAPTPLPSAPVGGASEWVKVFQETQRQTADAHAVYQRAMAESYSAFLQTAEAGFVGLSTLMGGGRTVPQSIPPAPMPEPTRSATPAPVYSQAPPPVAPVMATTAPAPAASAVATAVMSRPVAESSAVSVASVPDVAVDWAALMLSVVADKTGYPAEMLELGMDLEADLGIDSIKRVEILAAMQDRVPGMPAVETSALASLETLSAIVGYVQGLSGEGSGVATAVMSRPVAESSAVSVASVPDVAVDWAALMLSVVADKTGYPAEMLELDMDLEADLGIDSIKRVEILAAMQDRVPGMPAVETSALASLETLSAIVGYVQGLSGEGSGVATAVMSRPVAESSAVSVASVPDVAVDWAALMLSVVADKTGYPAEMLELDMDLEADLGIDSIKRVEILAAMQDRVPGMPAVETAALASLRSLAAIVEHVRGLSGETPADQSSDAPPIPENLSRYRLELIEAKPSGLAHPNLLGAEVYVTGGGGEPDAALAAALRTRGVKARASAEVPDNAVACVYLGGLRDVADEEEAASINRDAFRVAHRLGRTLEAGGGLFVTVQDTGGAFGLGPIDGRQAWLGGLPALVKTAGHEWPLASVKAIDLERGGRSTQELVQALADELLEGGGENEVALPARGGRFTVHTVDEPVVRGEPVIGPGDVVAVSGGARGVTATCLKAWAKECGARFVLLGRTELTAEPSFLAGIDDEAELIKALLGVARDSGESPHPAELRTQAQHIMANREIRRNLSGITKAGGVARYEAVDVCDLAAVTAVLDRVRADWGPITGLIHTAGVLADKMISEKTDEQFDYVFNTKVAGLRALLAATAEDPLKLLCVFSSIAGRSGNKGQADYAMANEVLAKVAESEHQRRPGLRVKSLAWGPWEGGMVTPALKRRFAALGVPMIPLEVGARMFADEMGAAQHGQVELVLGGRPRAEALLTDGAEAKVNELALSVGAKTHAFLEGHSISGTPVLPMVLAAEWLSRAARSFRPGMQLVALRDITVRKGVRLTGFDEGGDRFALQARPSPDRSDSTLCMELRGAGGILHYTASVEELSEWLTEDGLPDISLDTWDGGPLYGDVLFHRGDFELIEELHGISDEGVSAQIRGVERAGWPGGPWLMDVAALDGALQLAVVYGQRMLGGPNLPTAIDELRYFRSGPITGRVTATAFSRKVSDMSVTTDIVLIDELGQRVAELWGVHNYALPG